MGRPEQARVARDIWSTLRALAHRTESPGTAGRPCGPLHMGPSHPGLLVDPAVPWTKARVVRFSWLTPQAPGPGPESPVKNVQHRGPSDLCPSLPGKLVYSAGPRSCARVFRGAGRPHRPSNPSVIRPGQLVDPGGLWTWARSARGSCSTLQDLELVPESLETAGRLCGPRTLAFVARDSWSTLPAVGLEPDSPRRTGGPPGHSDTITSRLE